MRILIFLFIASTMSFSSEITYGPEIELRTKKHALVEISCASPFLFLPGWIAYDGISEGTVWQSSAPFLTSLVLAETIGQKITFRCSSHYSKTKINQLADLIKKNCLKVGCSVESIIHKTSHTSKVSEAYRIHYPDGNWFQLSTDNTAVEIQMKPMNLSEIEKFKPILQRDMFDIAHTIDLHKPRVEVLSGGHINIGFSQVFKENPLLLRNFIVDQINHSELYGGIFLKDPISAKSIYKKDKEFHYIQDIIEQFDRGEIKSSQELALNLSYVLKGDKFIDLQTIVREDFPMDQKRIEMRAHRSQKTANEFHKIVKLYEGRINYLKELTTPLNLRPIPISYDPKIQLSHFKTYVTESGFDLENFREILPAKYQDVLDAENPSLKCKKSILSLLTKLKR